MHTLYKMARISELRPRQASRSLFSHFHCPARSIPPASEWTIPLDPSLPYFFGSQTRRPLLKPGEWPVLPRFSRQPISIPKPTPSVRSVSYRREPITIYVSGTQEAIPKWEELLIVLAARFPSILRQPSSRVAPRRLRQYRFRSLEPVCLDCERTTARIGSVSGIRLIFSVLRSDVIN